MSIIAVIPPPARVLGVVLLVLTIRTPVAGGAWTQPAGGHYLKAAFSVLRSTEEFDHRGRRLEIQEEDVGSADASFRDISVTLYGEFGLRDDWTLVAQAPLKFLQSERRLLIGGGQLRPLERLRSAGVGDLSLQLRRALLTGATALSIQGGLTVPMGYDADSDEGPPLGVGRPTGAALLQIGRSLHPWPMYVSGAVGYRARRGPLDDEWLYEGEVGGHAGRMRAKLGFRGVQNRSKPPDIAGSTVISPLPGGGGVVPQLIVGDQHWLQVSPSILYEWRPGWAIQVEADRTVAGTNTLSGTTWRLAVVSTGN